MTGSETETEAEKEYIDGTSQRGWGQRNVIGVISVHWIRVKADTHLSATWEAVARWARQTKAPGECNMLL